MHESPPEAFQPGLPLRSVIPFERAFAPGVRGRARATAPRAVTGPEFLQLLVFVALVRISWPLREGLCSLNKGLFP